MPVDRAGDHLRYVWGRKSWARSDTRDELVKVARSRDIEVSGKTSQQLYDAHGSPADGLRQRRL